jgi:dihydroorotate dehydrogenase
MYSIIRKLFFLLDAEKAHYIAMNMLRFLCSIPGIRQLIIAIHKAPEQPTTLLGLPFKNKVGLGAGFDKNAKYLDALYCLGFGHVEIGTVTPIAQAGNDKPRLFRLPKDGALINRMGFNNNGMEAIAAQLKNRPNGLIVGGNIGKNKQTPNELAWKDYVLCFEALRNVVDYFTVNVSSPNTPGLRQLQTKESLEKIFSELQTINKKQSNPKPILLKIAPDLSIEDIDEIVLLTKTGLVDGLVISNTTISRDGLVTPTDTVNAIGAGGLSGKPVKKKSDEVLQYISNKLQGILPVIASGGVFTRQDALDKQQLGANLIQVWTGFIYVGPGIVKKITA